MATVNVNEMTFGVEIECAVPRSAMVAAGWTVGGYHGGHAVPGFPGWRADYDSSLYATDAVNFVCVEFVSPVLKGAAGLAALKTFVAKLVEMGATVNASCGFHVHVGFTPDLPAIRRLVNRVSNYQTAFYAQTGTHSRENGGMCLPVKVQLAAPRTGVTNDKLRDIAGGHSQRYCLLNLTNMVSGIRNAVEFRCFAGTMNYVKMAAHIATCLAVCHASMEKNGSPAWDAKNAFNEKGGAAIKRFHSLFGWTGRGKAYGIIDPTTLGAIKNMQLRMAAKYDGLVS